MCPTFKKRREFLSKLQFEDRDRSSSFTEKIQNLFVRSGSESKDRSVTSSAEDISNENKIFGRNIADVPTHLDGKLFGSQTGYGYNGTEGTSHGMLRKTSTITENGIPEVIVRCLKKINKEKTTVGLYRTNGENKAIKNLRLIYV